MELKLSRRPIESTTTPIYHLTRLPPPQQDLQRTHARTYASGMTEVAAAAAADPAAIAPAVDVPVILPSTTTTASRRLERTTVCLPIVHGSVAFYLGKKADDFQSHQWILYLRGPNNEDISRCIEKVVFQLHASFAQPVREYTHPPFEVTEKGWGEFEAQIRIHWKDPTEKVTMVGTSETSFFVKATARPVTKFRFPFPLDDVR